VYAGDVNKNNLDYIARRAKEQGYSNVEVILAKYDDPLLPEDGVDLIFTCNVYHHLKDRVDYFESAARYLRPDGRVAIIDLAGNSWIHRVFGHWTSQETSRSEMEAAGYQLTNKFDFLSRQTFQVFTLKTDHQEQLAHDTHSVEVQP
jgi:cyclopropane fatty-acyl-phospholipid synthase-like methyltransferase